LKKIVIMKGSFIDSLEEFVLRECLEIMFPECSIEIRSNPLVSIPDKEIRMKPDQNRFALYEEEKGDPSLLKQIVSGSL
jgi:hypothetical protein